MSTLSTSKSSLEEEERNILCETKKTIQNAIRITRGLSTVVNDLCTDCRNTIRESLLEEATNENYDDAATVGGQKI
jgi:hypothetical protein